MIVGLTPAREIFVLKKLMNAIEREIGQRKLIWFLYVLKLQETTTFNDLGIRMLPLVNGEYHGQHPPPTQPVDLPLEPTKMTMPWKLPGCLHHLLLVGRITVAGKVNQQGRLKINFEKELRRLVLGLRGVSRREWKFRMTRRGKGDHIGGKGWEVGAKIRSDVFDNKFCLSFIPPIYYLAFRCDTVHVKADTAHFERIVRNTFIES